MADLATLQTWLSEAEEARHALAMGEAVEGVTRDGRGMRYGHMSPDQLERYIAWLERKIEMATADAASRPRRGATTFSYGRCR